jgi:hypothetical protein
MLLRTLTTWFWLDDKKLVLAVALKKKGIAANQYLYLLYQARTRQALRAVKAASLSRKPPAEWFPKEKRRLIDGK